MPRLVAVEWDSREARVVAANLRPGELRVEQMFCVPLPSGDDPAAAGATLAAALAERKLNKSPALVSLARSQVELKPLTLPPAPDDELPSMARLQAVREFTSLADNWPLDYLPLTDNPAAQREVLAAAVSPETMERTGRTCAPAALEAMRYVVRPFAAASRFARTPEGRGCAVALLIDLSPAEADLTVVVERRVVFTRTARLSADVLATPEEARALVSEIRRTLAAVHTQLGARRVEAVYVLGATPQHAAICAKLQSDLNLPCHTVDPLNGTSVGREVIGDLSPTATGRFAGLLGALWDEAEGVPPAIDFLHPRRPPPPKRSQRPLLLGAAAAALLLLFASVLVIRILILNSRIKVLQASASQNQGLSKQIADAQKELDPYQEWQASDFNWLQELSWLARKLPDPDEMILTNVSITANERAGKAMQDARKKPAKTAGKAKADARIDGGTISFSGMAVSDTKARELLRGVDANHAIVLSNFTDDAKQSKYKYSFQGTVRLTPREVDKEPLATPPGREPEARPPGTATAALDGKQPK